MPTKEQYRKEREEKLEKMRETYRFFVEAAMVLYDLEDMIKKGGTEPVIQVLLKDSKLIKRFIWFLLKEDIDFKRNSMGAGISMFHIDTKLKFFVQGK